MGLLTRTRQINAMLQKTSGRSVNFKEMADTLSNVITANVYVLAAVVSCLVSKLASKLKTKE